jgi:hypothetical protein
VSVIAPFDPPTRPIAFTPHAVGWGPSHNDPCPCGSSILAGECHVSRSTSRWQLPPYTPLLAGEPTGYAHDRCYVGFTNDCSDKITQEHWLSEGILRLFGEGKTVRVGGLPWQEQGPQNWSIKNLSAKILCDRHNSAMWRLDTTATDIQTTLERYQLSQLQQLDPRGSEFDLYSGEELERWLLKLIWGFSAANKNIPDNLRASKQRKTLAQYLFRDGLLPKHWGLYMKGTAEGVIADADVGIEIRSDPAPNGDLLAVTAVMGVVAFTFVWGRITTYRGSGAFATHRPSGVCLYSAYSAAAKVLALSWDHGKRSRADVVDLKFKGAERKP